MRTHHDLSKNWAFHSLSESIDEREAIIGADTGQNWREIDLPSGVHEALFRAGSIPDARVDKNAEHVQWVGEQDWIFRTSFDTPERDAASSFLVFDAIDTLGEIYLNGHHIGSTNNQYVEQRLEVTQVLLPAGEQNLLAVVLRSAVAWVDEFQTKSTEDPRVPANYYLRKGAGDFALYLGASPRFIHVGLPGRVSLDQVQTAHIDSLRISTPEVSAGSALVRLQAEVAAPSGAEIQFVVTAPSGEIVASTTGGEAEWTTAVSDPLLWWPRGYGDQAIYKATVEVLVDGQVADSRIHTFGIRTIELRTTNKTGEPVFQIVVNGTPIYAQGACWIPVQGISHVWDQDRATTLLDLAEHSHMNILRVWGGGLYPDDRFYDECDRRGILVWQDFMFDYWMYPSSHQAFAESFAGEIESVVRRLRNHPSVALWVGGNENYMAWEFFYGPDPAPYQELFDRVIPALVAENDGTRAYHLNSPWGGDYADDASVGDWHDYTFYKFSPHATVPLFASEFGRVSAPILKSMEAMLSPENLWPEGHDARVLKPGQPAWPPLWEFRSAPPAWEKIGQIERYPDANNAADLIRVLGTAHGDYLQDRAERHRRGVPDGGQPGHRNNWGSVIWRLNDTWPILYWSVVDAYLEPKIAYYYLRRAYNPVLVSFECGVDSIRVWVVNDSATAVNETLRVVWKSWDGTVRQEKLVSVTAQPGEAIVAAVLDDFGQLTVFDSYLEAALGDITVTQTLAAERYLQFPDAELTVSLVEDDLIISSDTFARQVVLTSDSAPGGVVFSDNYFDVSSDRSQTVAISGGHLGGTVTISALNTLTPVVIELPKRISLLSNG